VPLYASAFGTNEQRLLQAIYAAMDDTNRGWISFSQFVTALSTIYRGDKDDVLAFWFKMYDADRDGFLDRQVGMGVMGVCRACRATGTGVHARPHHGIAFQSVPSQHCRQPPLKCPIVVFLCRMMSTLVAAHREYCMVKYRAPWLCLLVGVVYCLCWRVCVAPLQDFQRLLQDTNRTTMKMIQVYVDEEVFPGAAADDATAGGGIWLAMMQYWRLLCGRKPSEQGHSCCCLNWCAPGTHFLCQVLRPPAIA